MNDICRSFLKKYEPIWGGWHVEEFIGEGSYGKVFRIYKEEWGLKLESALKVISVPTREQMREARASIGSDADKLKQYFEEMVRGMANEIRLLYKLRGNSNIVSYEDHLVEAKSDETGWDILIRMEYLNTLTSYIDDRKMDENEVAQLGADICSALEICRRHGIVHRDIKDDNIFVTDDGTFKLGDFSIAKELSNCGGAASMRGTPLYVAPEVFKGGGYDARADIYSLGIVLYKLLNHGRLPFMPHYPLELGYKDSETAVVRRLSGEAIPEPAEGSDKLKEIVLKACAFKPSERYQDAAQMKRDLMNLLSVRTEDWYLDLEDGKLCVVGEKKEDEGSEAEGDIWFYL
ncbi:MAG: serine/threonine protein kinase [Clostridia bacterium]|nr:serine/threonine protein kinase [Clostridia bacterium]